MKKNIEKNKKTIVFFAVLFLIIIFLFKNALTFGIFSDDYFFLKISRISTIQQFINFFSPIRTYSYKPLSSEVFYFFISKIGYNFFLGHLFVFGIYFLGLIYFWKNIKNVTKKSLLAYITTFIYGISFIHVFQLYWLATFQEIMVFTSLNVSFYYFLKNKYPISFIGFIVACLSKETAILFLPFLVFFEIIFDRKNIRTKKIVLALYMILGVIFYFLYKDGLSHVTSLDNYKIQLTNFRLIANNFLWYLLWSLGVPNFMPDVMTSIFAKPLPTFYKDYLKNLTVKEYFYSLIIFYSLFFSSLMIFILKNKKEIKKISIYLLVCFLSFLIFLGPILFFSHKWMVRLTIPLIFVSIFQGYIIFMFFKNKKVFNIISFILIILYVIMTYLGIRVHESSSVYMLENKIYKNSQSFFSKSTSVYMLGNNIYKNGQYFPTKKLVKLQNCKNLFFADNGNPKTLSNWGVSKKLENSYWDQYFLDFYFPNKKMAAFYQFKSTAFPSACIIESTDIFTGKN